MKSKFPGYFKLTKEEINQLWKTALFTFDANILLNLYRYSDETREEFYKILEKIKDRIWIPHQSAQEFFNNRLAVIGQQEKSYEEAISAINTLESEFKNSRQHPFINSRLLKKFSNLSKDICEQLNENKQFHNKRIQQDDILEKIEKLFNDKVGEEYNSERIEQLYREGDTRFSNKVPPGYKDSNKKDDVGRNGRQYGDLVVWKQTIEKSKESKNAIILITDDRKEDWWVRFNGKTIGPRPELIKEFKDETSKSFHMYQSDRFLEFAREYLNETINEKAIEEIRELRRLDEKRRLSEIRREQEKSKYLDDKESLFKDSQLLEEELKYLEESKIELYGRIEVEKNKLDNSDPSAFDTSQMEKLQKVLLNTERHIMHILVKRDELRERYKSMQSRLSRRKLL
ncbi:PIN-like domain-containing protein [Arcticibacterium luteifluviistationis]|uniref:PIN like domain-containing protein n=1 Tax=Arcticibacterium luteifluviistationis TaxID=1784714 RepID=A0A2Z4G6X3_9BACT|nr:PIN-like domain-containing protein [Arcticibacterium luteifluviistationis]AWV96907.1 hypothetical protein DJ013_01420 [Arcticibacterium luteifluviistationis]